MLASRKQWQDKSDTVETIKIKGETNEEGYINVSEQFGLSRVRGIVIGSSYIFIAILLTFDRFFNLSSTLGSSAKFEPLLTKSTCQCSRNKSWLSNYKHEEV